MSISPRKWMPVLLLVAGPLFAADRDPTTAARGRYIPITGNSPRIIRVGFGFDASFWVAQLTLDGFSANGYEITLTQQDAKSQTTNFRPATDQEWEQAKLRLFFDAVFWKRYVTQIRAVLVRRVNESGHQTLYVEPMP